jgi:hypothetical protein
MKRSAAVLAAIACIWCFSVALPAHAPSGAIFTTVADGSEVNFNHYAAKEDVYLDGGPGPGAPQGAAGLDDGTYVFQVTDPSGKVLLSQDIARCRRFTVSGGVITGLVIDGCPAPHMTGVDSDHAAVTVQLMPYANTSNNGGVYKVWATTVEDYLLGCQELGKPGDTGLDLVGCGGKVGGNSHGFIPSHSKTDNFKVKATRVREIDTRFFNDLNVDGHQQEGEEFMDGLFITWTDPLGGGNKKWSYWAPDLMIFHEAHVEAIEDGAHLIDIRDQPGCKVGMIHVDEQHTAIDGPQVVTVPISHRDREITIFVDVSCTPL